MEIAAAEKKRTLGVTIVAILVMASGLAGVSSILPPQASIEMFIKPFGVIIFCVCLLLSLGEVFLAANVLRYKEWSRVGLIAVMLANVVFLLFTPFLYNPAYVSSQEATLAKDLEKMKITQDARVKEMRVRFEDKIKTLAPAEKERMRQAFDSSLNDLPQMVLRLTMLMLGFAAFIWYVGVIYYFTRPKIIAHFE